MTGTVEHIENLGHEIILTLATDLGAFVLREVLAGDVPTLGRSVQIAIDPSKAHFFDPQSEQRIE